MAFSNCWVSCLLSIDLLHFAVGCWLPDSRFSNKCSHLLNSALSRFLFRHSINNTITPSWFCSVVHSVESAVLSLSFFHRQLLGCSLTVRLLPVVGVDEITALIKQFLYPTFSTGYQVLIFPLSPSIYRSSYKHSLLCIPYLFLPRHLVFYTDLRLPLR